MVLHFLSCSVSFDSCYHHVYLTERICSEDGAKLLVSSPILFPSESYPFAVINVVF